MRQLLGHDQPVIPDHGPARGPDALLAIGRQWQLRDARVPAVERPLRLAVADDEDPGCGHGDCRVADGNRSGRQLCLLPNG